MPVFLQVIARLGGAALKWAWKNKGKVWGWIKDLRSVEWIVDKIKDNWGYCEMILFGNAMGALTLQSIIALSKEVLKKSKLYLKLKSNRIEVIQILLNTITYCLEGKRYTDALYFIKALEDTLEASELYFEKTKLLFLKGIYKIKTGTAVDQGVASCRKAIQIMNDMDSIELVVNHENYLELLLEGTNYFIYDKKNSPLVVSTSDN